MSNDEQDGTAVSGVVTRFYPSEDENKPHGLYVDGDRYTTFEDADVDEIEEGLVVRFRYMQNGDHRNIVSGTVEIVDDPEPEVYGKTDEIEPFSPTDARIASQSVLRSAVLHHQHRGDSTDEDIVTTAVRFADVQVALYEWLRSAGQQEDEA